MDIKHCNLDYSQSPRASTTVRWIRQSPRMPAFREACWHHCRPSPGCAALSSVFLKWHQSAGVTFSSHAAVLFLLLPPPSISTPMQTGSEIGLGRKQERHHSFSAALKASLLQHVLKRVAKVAFGAGEFLEWGLPRVPRILAPALQPVLHIYAG